MKCVKIETEKKKVLDQVVKELDMNMTNDPLLCESGHSPLPNRRTINELVKTFRMLLFPGIYSENFYQKTDYNSFLWDSLDEALCILTGQIELAMKYHNEVCDPEEIHNCAEDISLKFAGELPRIQRQLLKDVDAGFAGDPAAKSKEEIIFSYPGFFAICVYRMAHVLYELGVPIIPRMMTEYAHSGTGIDINPGARIGEFFFIDHGTGVVIGETTEIGDNVKLYQGVTLGALSTRKGQLLSDVKRHPTIEDNVTVYSGASILGGETVIGKNSTIGGSAFITDSVNSNTRVSVKAPELYIKLGKPGEEDLLYEWSDYVI